jgi:uncharacterized membrane protein
MKREDLSMSEHELRQAAWREVTEAEQRLPVTMAVLAAIFLQATLPSRYVVQPRAIPLVVQLLLLVGLTIANPRRINRESNAIRAGGIALTAVITAANAYSAGRLIDDLLTGQVQLASELLPRGGTIWLTNVIVFALWYWEADRGGPARRAHGVQKYPDFLFPQMANPELAPPDWEPTFVDYLYTSFTNATAFSPTDTMPMSRWAKMLMLLQSAVSLSLVVLVVARAVNVLH